MAHIAELVHSKSLYTTPPRDMAWSMSGPLMSMMHVCFGMILARN